MTTNYNYRVTIFKNGKMVKSEMVASNGTMRDVSRMYPRTRGMEVHVELCMGPMTGTYLRPFTVN